jgi:hypothetical protein
MNDEIIIGGDAVDIPPGTYPGKLSAVSTKTSVAWGDFRAWDFLLDEGHIVGGGSSMSTGSKSKGGRWIAALLGRKPDKGENVTAAIIGRPCLVVVGLKDEWPTVLDVLPPLAGSSTAAQNGPVTAVASVPMHEGMELP